MSETIFWGLWEADLINKQVTCDRMQFFDEQKTFRDLFNWLKSIRNSLEKQYGANMVLRDFKMMSSEPNVQASVATDDHQGTEAGKQI